MMSQSILYYPTIDIQDGNWLRNAVLYWDSVSSIVPFEEYDQLSPELKYLKENGVYFPSFPADLFQSRYADEFSTTFLSRLKNYTSQKTTVSHIEQRCSKKTGRQPLQSSAIRARQRIHKKKIHAPLFYDLIHRQKIPPTLRKLLSDNHLIDDYGFDGWMEIDSNVAEIYMQTLAEYTAKSSCQEMVIGTDKRSNQEELYCRLPSSLPQVCYSLQLENCFPQPRMDTSYEDILAFKESRKQELQHFRILLRDLEKTLSNCQSAQEIKFAEESFREQWQVGIADMEKMYKDCGIACVLGSIRSLIDVPVVSEIIKERIGHTLSPLASAIILGGAAMINIAPKILDYKNKINEQKRNSGFLYILEGQKESIIGQS